MTSSDLWDQETAERYDATSAEMFAPEVLTPAVDLLSGLAEGGPALEFAVGTGRVAVPLSRRGIAVTGIELSAPMVAQLRRKADDRAIPVAVGDMATTRVPGDFSLVYLVFNTLGNLRTQDEQVECFRNAARHLRSGGRFVIEIGVPALRRLPPGQSAVPFDISEEHLGFDTYDPVTQQAVSHHYHLADDGTARYARHNYRYVWPSECDLMARLAGLELEDRFADWHRRPFTADSESHVSVWRKP
ncbi:MAG TPA: class I SAM-dependent methyltransferase [Marmoricola sp.]|nr:class I SAM-dependent methyltransferase [Marmoricola sp.]